MTIANSVGFMNLHADMAAQAGFMSLAVGTLAYALVKGGAAGFSQLASHMTGPMSSAAGRAAEDQISGNYSFGNVSQGTVQAYNASFGQQNLSPSYSSGSFTQNDGVISRTTSSEGGHMVNVSNSNLRSNLNFSESLSNSYTKQASRAKQMSETQMFAAAQAESDHNRQVMDFSEHKAKQTSGSESYSTGETASANQSFTKLDGLVDRFAKDHSISKEVAAQVLARATASASVGAGFELFGNGATAHLTGEIGGSISGSASNRDLFSKAQDYSKQSNFQTALSQASQSARDSRYSENSDQGKRAVSSINDSYEKSHQYRNEASASLQKSESFSQMASQTRQNAGSINANLNQEYVNWLQGQSLPNSSGAMGIHEAETILSSRPELDHQYQQRFIEDKMAQAERYVGSKTLGSHGMPRSGEDIDRAFHQAKGNIVSPVHQDVTGGAASQASSQGLRKDFKVNTQPREKAQRVLQSTGMLIAEQHGALSQQGNIRKAEVGLDETKMVKPKVARTEMLQPSTVNIEDLENRVPHGQNAMTQTETKGPSK